jgi:AraC-like DNA-binding protein/mannose-6-phosphate isomerase-like protein (cupin superfamily)
MERRKEVVALEPIVYKLKECVDRESSFQILFRDTRHLNYDRHAHDCFQICYIWKGSCLNALGSNEADLVQGDMFAVPPFMPHRISPVSDSEVVLVQIDFLPEFINESMRDSAGLEGFVDFAYLQPLLAAGQKSLPKLNVSASNQLTIEGIVQKMALEWKEKEEGYMLAIRAELLRLLMIAGREYRKFLDNKQEKPLMNSRRKAFYDTVTHIRQHYKEELSLDQMADKAAMSPSYFSHMFKLLIGVSFVDFVNERRIKEAMELLRDTDLSVTNIGLDIGYRHIGHFNRMFKKHTGQTPSEFRKQSRQSP